MDSSRKSFKALGVAQPLKREIDDILMKVELEKRKYLTLEREESFLKETLQQKRRTLNALKAKEPQTQKHSIRVREEQLMWNNVDRTSLNITDHMAQSRKTIDAHRKQINKHKQMNERLLEDIRELEAGNANINKINEDMEMESEDIKEKIMELREVNLRNTGEFQASYKNVNRVDSADENQRRKFSMKQKSFLGEELRNSKVMPFDSLSDQLRVTGLNLGDSSSEIMTEALPLAKERIRSMIYSNKEKLKISQNYRRFGENLENMFTVMKEYKGRDDLTFIAEEFVTKEKQLQKIEEYIGQLETRIQTTQYHLREKVREDRELEDEVTAQVQREDQRYIAEQQAVQQDIAELEERESKFMQWFQKIGEILTPLLPAQQSLTRNNAANLIGDIESGLNFTHEEVNKPAPGKALPLPAIDLPERQIYNELLSYDKMREFAHDYVRNKKTN